MSRRREPRGFIRVGAPHPTLVAVAHIVYVAPLPDGQVRICLSTGETLDITRATVEDFETAIREAS